MKTNKKGFTLIELLAVIVILAIIALIAVPVIMNIITNARKSAAADSAYSILKSAEFYYAQQLLVDPTEVYTDTTFSFEATPEAGHKDGSVLDIKGTAPTGGTVTVDANGKATLTDLVINNFTCNANTNGVVTCDDADAE